MIEDTSPENLRKFLESDDPAMVLMGLSMAKGSGVPEKLLPPILGLYIWDDDPVIRAAAKSVFTKHASEDIQDGVVRQKVTEDLGDIPDKRAVEPLIKALVGILGDKRAVEPLIKVLEHLSDECQFGEKKKGYAYFHDAEDALKKVIEALGKIGDERAAEALIKNFHIPLSPHTSRLKYRMSLSGIYGHSATALGEIGDKQAVEPLIKRLSPNRTTYSDENFLRREAAKALGKIGDERAVEPLINSLKDKYARVRVEAAKSLGNIGDKRALEPLKKLLEILRSYESMTILELKKFLKKKIKNGERNMEHEVFLISGNKSDLIARLEDKTVQKVTVKALKKLGHEVE